MSLRAVAKGATSGGGGGAVTGTSVTAVNPSGPALVAADGQTGSYAAYAFKQSGVLAGYIGLNVYALDNNVYIGGTATPVLGCVLSGNRVLIDTTTDDGVNKLQVNGVAAVKGLRNTSSSANAFSVGQNGATNPAFNVDCSTASSVTGLNVKSGANGAGLAVSVTSSGSNTNLTIDAKGTGTITIAGTSTGAVTITRATTLSAGLTLTGTFAQTDSASGTAATIRRSFVGASDTALTASTEAPSVYYNMGQTRQHATGALTHQRDFRVTGSNHSFVGASTLTDHAAFSVDLSTGNATNATITNTHAVFITGVTLTGTKTNSYGLTVNANAGATNNYIAQFVGSAGQILLLRTDGRLALLATNTAGGTTGAQTINRPSGTVNFAAAATSLVVTNSLVTTSSLVVAFVRTADSTAIIKNVVPAAGSFTINLNAAATAETSVGFIVVN